MAQTSAETQQTSQILGRWLVGFRWAMLALLAAMLPAGERWFGFHVRYEIALPALGLAFAIHAIAQVAKPKALSSWALGGFVALDIAVTGIVLGASGGAANPFSALFLVHVALAAALLAPRVTFALSAFAALVFGALFAVPTGSCCAAHAVDGSFSTHLYGMWTAFVLSAALVAFFATRIRRALEQRDQELGRLRHEAEQAARFAAVGTLAAGTAHELGTPLGTIAVLAEELKTPGLAGAEVKESGEAILAAVARCKDVVGRMQGAVRQRAADVRGIDVGAIVEGAVRSWRGAHPGAPIEVVVTQPSARAAGLSAEDLEAAIGVLLDNAWHATREAGAKEPVQVSVEVTADRVGVAVEDHGAGVAPEDLDRLGEPFRTTKAPGEGMGLGLYFVRTLVTQAGGRLLAEARKARGLRVALWLPAAPAMSGAPG